MFKTTLSSIGTTFVTPKNQNLPEYTTVSLASMDQSSKFAVFEIAMYDQDTVGLSSELVRLEIAIITAIGKNHAGNLKNQSEQVISAKTKIFGSLTGRGLVILYSHEKAYSSLRKRAQDCPNVNEIVSVGHLESDFVQLLSYDELATQTRVKIRADHEIIEYTIDQPGFHFVMSSLLVAAALFKSNLSMDSNEES